MLPGVFIPLLSLSLAGKVFAKNSPSSISPDVNVIFDIKTNTRIEGFSVKIETYDGGVHQINQTLGGRAAFLGINKVSTTLFSGGIYKVTFQAAKLNAGVEAFDHLESFSAPFILVFPGQNDEYILSADVAVSASQVPVERVVLSCNNCSNKKTFDLMPYVSYKGKKSGTSQILVVQGSGILNNPRYKWQDIINSFDLKICKKTSSGDCPRVEKDVSVRIDGKPSPNNPYNKNFAFFIPLGTTSANSNVDLNIEHWPRSLSILLPADESTPGKLDPFYGTYRGEQHARLYLMVGQNYEITVSAEGYLDAHQKIKVEEGKGSITVGLVPRNSAGGANNATGSANQAAGGGSTITVQNDTSGVEYEANRNADLSGNNDPDERCINYLNEINRGMFNRHVTNPLTCALFRGIGDGLDWVIRQIEAVVGVRDPRIPYLNIRENLTEAGAQTNGITWVIIGWRISLTLGYSIVGILLLIVVFANILRIDLEHYGIRRIIPSLIFNLFLANFSLIFIRFFVDITNVLGSGINALFVNAAGVNEGSIGRGLTATFLGTVTPVGRIPIIGGALSTVFIIILSGIVGLVALVFLLILLFEFLLRSTVIYLLAILAPLAFVLNSFPMLQNYAKKWWSYFWPWIFMYPAVMLLLNLAALPGLITLAPGNQSAGSFNFIGIIASMLIIWNAIKLPISLGGALQTAWNSLGKSAYGGLYHNLNRIGRSWSQIDPRQVNPGRFGWRRGLAYVQRGIGMSVGNRFSRWVLGWTNLYALPEAWKQRVETQKRAYFYTAIGSRLANAIMGYNASYRHHKSENAETIRSLSTLQSVADYVNRLPALRNRNFSRDDVAEFMSQGTTGQIEWARRHRLDPESAAQFWLALHQAAITMRRSANFNDVINALAAHTAQSGIFAGGATPIEQNPNTSTKQDKSKDIFQNIEIPNEARERIENYADLIRDYVPEELRTETININGRDINLGNLSAQDAIALAVSPLKFLKKELKNKNVGDKKGLKEFFGQLGILRNIIEANGISPNSLTIGPEPTPAGIEEPPPTKPAPNLPEAPEVPSAARPSTGQTATTAENKESLIERRQEPLTTIKLEQPPDLSQRENIHRLAATINTILGGNYISARAIRRGTSRWYKFGFSSLAPKNLSSEERFENRFKELEGLLNSGAPRTALEASVKSLLSDIHIRPIIEPRLVQIAQQKNLPLNPQQLVSLIGGSELKQSLAHLPAEIDRAINEVRNNNLANAIEITKNLNIGINTEILEKPTGLTEAEKQEFLSALSERKADVESLLKTTINPGDSAEKLIDGAVTNLQNFEGETNPNMNNIQGTL